MSPIHRAPERRPEQDRAGSSCPRHSWLSSAGWADFRNSSASVCVLEGCVDARARLSRGPATIQTESPGPWLAEDQLKGKL